MEHSDAAIEAGWDWPDDEPTPGRTSRRGLLVAAATLPWLAVALLLLRPQAPANGSIVTPTPLHEASASAPPVEDPSPEPGLERARQHPDGTFMHAPEAWMLSSGGRHTVDVGDAVTLAMVVARAWVGGAGPTLAPVDAALGGGPPGYLEHLWVEAVDAPWPGQVVVTLGATVLVPDSEGLRPEPRRLAVPVRLDADGARAAGAPYPLPGPAILYDPLAFEPVDDPASALAITDALTDAGYRVDEVHTVAQSPSWPWRATFTGAAPGSASDGPHQVWLRPHLGGFVVAGWLPTRPPTGGGPDTTDDEEPAP